jgi:hypothetical protein
MPGVIQNFYRAVLTYTGAEVASQSKGSRGRGASELRDQHELSECCNPDTVVTSYVLRMEGYRKLVPGEVLFRSTPP